MARRVAYHLQSCRSFAHSTKVSKVADLKTKADFLEERVTSRALRLIGTGPPDSPEMMLCLSCFCAFWSVCLVAGGGDRCCGCCSCSGCSGCCRNDGAFLLWLRSWVVVAVVVVVLVVVVVVVALAVMSLLLMFLIGGGDGAVLYVLVVLAVVVLVGCARGLEAFMIWPTKTTRWVLVMVAPTVTETKTAHFCFARVQLPSSTRPDPALTPLFNVTDVACRDMQVLHEMQSKAQQELAHGFL